MALDGTGVQGDEYLIASPADWVQIPDFDSSVETIYFLVSESFSFSAPVGEIITFFGDLNLNGKKIDGITSLIAGRLIRNLEGKIHGGAFGVNITTNDGGSETLIDDVASSGTFEQVSVEGTLQASGTGDASILNSISSNNITDCVFDVDITTVDGMASIVGSSSINVLYRCVNTGRMQATGTGSAYPFSNVSGLIEISCYYDSTINSDLSPFASEKAVPTTDLYDIGTYSNDNNIYFGVARTTASATQGGNTLTGSTFERGVLQGFDFSIAVGQNIRIGNDANREVVEIANIVSDTEITIVGTFANDHTNETWFQLTPNVRFDIVDQSVYNNETWAIDDGVAYPILGVNVEGVLAPSFTFTNTNGQPAVGAVARFFQIDAFSSASPTLANIQYIGSEYVTDANGVATYDPDTDPALDGTKVYGAIAFYAEAGETEMDCLVGAEIGRQNVDLTNPV